MTGGKWYCEGNKSRIKKWEVVCCAHKGGSGRPQGSGIEQKCKSGEEDHAD